MPRTRLKVKLTDDAVAAYSTQHPDEEFWILTGHPSENGLSLLLATETADIAAVVQYFADTPEVTSYEVLYVDNQGVLIELSVPESALHRAILASGNLPSYPLIVRRGWVVCELITSQERLSSLKDEFENTGLPYEVVSVTPSLEPIDLLTDQQRRFVVEAIERGYYESPRRCSLTDLADVLEVSKSTASGVLHRAEGKIITRFIGESTG